MCVCVRMYVPVMEANKGRSNLYRGGALGGGPARRRTLTPQGGEIFFEKKILKKNSKCFLAKKIGYPRPLLDPQRPSSKW